MKYLIYFLREGAWERVGAEYNTQAHADMACVLFEQEQFDEGNVVLDSIVRLSACSTDINSASEIIKRIKNSKNGPTLGPLG